MSAAVVTKSSPVLVVGPPGGDDAVVHLTSSLDRSVVPFRVTVLLLFDRPIPQPAETIRTALSEALAHYRPVAGRLAADDGELLRIEGAAGVPFIAASARCALADVAEPMLGGLAPWYPAGLCRHGDPLLLVQVTEFACGGFAVAATWNHVLTDGEGIAQFLGAVGELARGASPAPSVRPLRADDGSLPRLPQSMVAAQKQTLSCTFNRDFVLLDVTVPAGLIGRVRAEFDAAGLDDGKGKQPCTVFEAVAAVLWQCRTRAAVVSVSDEAPVALSFAANVRRLVGARPGYYGNCVVMQSVTSTRGEVANGAVADVARMIRRAKEGIPDLLAPSGGTAAEQGAMALPYSTLVLSCWRNLGFEATDFGGGRPARVTWHGAETVVPGCVLCPPGKDGGKDGVSVMSLCVRPEHADAFLAELTTFQQI
ncbi:acyl transferase 15-like [Triticum dicoccoides]|uniref:acyl transferase 15-like n=1 Tax=Triticum dicoccoides TaxID=85692 RepID=UPI00188FBCDB|nr:acyl transferase 15-like [Triticum dicoccoides]